MINGENQYYIRFPGRDKRCDRWVKITDLRPVPAENRAMAAQMKKMAETESEGGVHNAAGSSQVHIRVTDAKNIHTLHYGMNETVYPWYFSPYPDEYGAQDTLYICPHCLTYLRSSTELEVHMRQCTMLNPPGDEIWREESQDKEGTLSFWEIDGRLQKTYCQNLCLLSRLFLEHKTLHYDVEAFLFYCLTKKTDSEHQLLGYFSKEKQNSNTLACILTLPQHQHKGYSRLLMDMSYALCRIERRRGGPEEPLSDLGTASFKNYWREEVFLFLYQAMREQAPQICVEQIAEGTGISTQHIIQTLQENQLLYYSPTLGKHLICCWDAKVMELVAHVAEKAKSRRRVHPDQICWRPLPSMLVVDSESRDSDHQLAHRRMRGR